MGVFDTNQFRKSVMGQVLRKLAEAGNGAAPPDALGLTRREVSAFDQLERLGLVRLKRGEGTLSWRIEHAEITEAGRAKLAED